MVFTHADMVYILTPLLPNYLWMGNDAGIYHIDGYQYHFHYSKFEPNQEILIPIGRVVSNRMLICTNGREKDPMHIVLRHRHNNSYIKGVCQFLQEIGGKYEEYKEIITLLTGENPVYEGESYGKS